MLEPLYCVNFLCIAPRVGGGVTVPLAQRLSTLGYVTVTIAARGLPQDAANTHTARARVDALH